MPKGKKKPRRPKPTYLYLLFGAMLFLSGCAFLDRVTGVDDPEVVAGEKPSMLEKASEEAETALPWPWSLIAGLAGGYGAKAYRDARLAKKAREEAKA